MPQTDIFDAAEKFRSGDVRIKNKKHDKWYCEGMLHTADTIIIMQGDLVDCDCKCHGKGRKFKILS